MNIWAGLIGPPGPRAAVKVRRAGYRALLAFRTPSKPPELPGDGSTEGKHLLARRLLDAGFVERVQRGVYRTTGKGLAAIHEYEHGS